jgi:hypothetical protein
MSQLQTFLQAKEPLFDLALRQLELRTHQKGVDAALTGEIATKAAKAIQGMNLPVDVSGEHLYEVLIQTVKQHDEHLARAIGGTDPTNVAEMIPLIVKRLEQVDMPRRGFFLKADKARQMLASMPPTTIMEKLGYKDIDTMLERENLNELFLALRFVQEADWLVEFNKQYDALKGSDFEDRDIVVVPFSVEKWGDIAAHFIEKKRHNITHSKEMGAIAIMPMAIENMPGVTLKVMPLLCHYFNEIRLYSTYFKLLKSKKNFGEIVSKTLIADTPAVQVMSGQTVHWRVIQRYFAKLKEPHPEIFEPHVQPEDLHWRKAETILYEVDPELEFWRDLDYVAVQRGDDTITFNLMDVSLSYSNSISFDERYLYHFRESLWNEIFARYMTEKVLEEQLLEKLSSDMIAPEKLEVG